MADQKTVIRGSEARKQSTLFDVGEKIRCLTFELENTLLVVPNAAIAEVIGVGEIETLPDAPEWFSGMMSWRELKIPVISLEKLIAPGADIPSSYKKMVVFNAVDDFKGIKFYALGCQTIPSLSMMDATRLDVFEQNFENANTIIFEGIEAVIPDLAAIESKIKTVLE